MDNQDSTKQLAKAFIWVAWIIAIALLVFVFQDVLDKQYNPNAEPQNHLNQAGLAEVYLQQNRQGHYVVNGTINDSPVTFLLDTGATQVSIPAHIAQQLNLASSGSYPAKTANGTVTVYKTKLDQVSIGIIYLDNVDANINPGMQGDEILLGMSALKRIEFSQTGKQLILREQR